MPSGDRADNGPMKARGNDGSPFEHDFGALGPGARNLGDATEAGPVASRPRNGLRLAATSPARWPIWIPSSTR